MCSISSSATGCWARMKAVSGRRVKHTQPQVKLELRAGSSHLAGTNVSDHGDGPWKLPSLSDGLMKAQTRLPALTSSVRWS